MDTFVGYCVLGDTYRDFLQVADAAGAPYEPDAAPAYRVYGPQGVLASVQGTMTLAHTGVVTAASNANPVVVTSAAHGLTSGTKVRVQGVGGNTNANGLFAVTRLSADTFSLPVAGNGAYTSGGTWQVAGLYQAAVACLGGSGFEAGESFKLFYSWLATGSPRHTIHRLGVN